MVRNKLRPSKKLSILILYMLCGISLYAQDTLRVEADSSSFSGADSDTAFSMSADSTGEGMATEDSSVVLNLLDRTVENNAFKVGEKLTFKIRYGWIKAGEATMEVREKITTVGDREAYRIVSTAKSSRGFDPFYKVRDEVETHLDAEGFFSWYFSKKLREGGYKFDLMVNYDQPKGRANVNTIRYHKDEPLRIRNEKQFSVSVPEYVLDILSAFYYVRTQDLEVGMPIYMTNHDKNKIYDLKVLIEKKETIKVNAGEFRCFKVQPILQGDALFKQKGKLWVWLTDDQYKIPVQMKSKVAVGSITTELISMEGIPERPPAQKK